MAGNLIREDWVDMMSAFYFPRSNKVIKDESIRKWVERVNSELTEEGQDVP